VWQVAIAVGLAHFFEKERRKREREREREKGINRWPEKEGGPKTENEGWDHVAGLGRLWSVDSGQRGSFKKKRRKKERAKSEDRRRRIFLSEIKIEK